MKTKRILSMALVFCLCLTMLLTVVLPTQATSYNISAAVSYANSHWNDGVGLCAEFVSKCLAAGGVTIPNSASYYSSSTQSYNNNSGTLGAYTNPYTCSASLLLYLSKYYTVIANPNSSQIDIGDVVFMYSGEWRDGHVGIIINKNNGTPTYAAHNRATNTGKFYSNYPCTYVVKMNGVIPPVTHTKDSTYGTNFTAYPKAKITAENILNEYHNQWDSTSYIAVTDLCTIHEVYTDGCCKVTYPLDAGGTKTVYSKISLFNIHTHSYTGSRYYESDHPHKVWQKCVDYDTCGGWIYTGEYYKKNTCEQCWCATFNIGASSISIKVGESKTISASISDYCLPSTAVMIRTFTPDNGIVDVSIKDGQATFTGLSAGTTKMTWTVYSDSSKSHIIATATTPITVTNQTYTVSYNANGGSGAPSNQTKTHGVSLTLSSAKPTRTGYTFLGWSTSSTATSATYLSGGSFSIDKNTTLYAVWKKGCSGNNHNYSAWTKVNDTQHKRTCSACQNVETASHSWNSGAVTKQPTCKEAGVRTYTCTTCGGTKTESIAKLTTHSYGSWAKVDNSTHKRTCSVCQKIETASHSWNSGAVTKQPTCKEAGVRTYTCTTCGGTKTESIAKLTTHSWNNGSVTKQPTCKEAGVRTYTCTTCGGTKTESIAKLTTHSYGSWTKVDNNTHKHTCSVCQNTETASHSWNSGAVTKRPTCKEAGVRTYTCTVCGGTKTESISKLTTHTWNSGAVTKQPTCKEVGVRTYTCTVCGGTKTESIAKLTTHSWNSGAVTKQPTCKEAGVRTYTCTVCGGTKTESIAKLTTHTYGDWTKVGNSTHRRTCSVCQKIETASHSWNSGAVTKQPTCKAAGVKTYTCTICGGTKTEGIDKLTSHTYDNACDTECNICGNKRTVSHQYSTQWIMTEANHWRECTVCGEKKDWSAHTPGAAATETTAQTCTQCGYVIRAALGHTHRYSNSWSKDSSYHWHACACGDRQNVSAHVYTNACDTDCNTCGYVRTVTHSYSQTWTKDASGHWNACTVCGAKANETVHVPGVEATETTAQTCVVCGYELTPALGHTHAFGQNWITDAENHWKICNCGEKTEFAAHSWEDGSCSVCGANDPNATEPTEPSTKPTTPSPSEPTQPAPSQKDDGGTKTVLVVGIVCLAGGVAVGVFAVKKKRQ